jgi:hypothetical protein
MIRLLKILGLTFVAVLAMTASVAPVAQAVPQTTCSSYPCTATGSNTAGSETFTTPGGTVQCNSHFGWEKYRTASGESIPANATTFTETTSYSTCTAFGFLGADLHEEGCDYEIHHTQRLAPGRYKQHVMWVCSVPSGARITAGTCEVRIPPQGPLSTVETTNLANGTVTVVRNLTSVTLNVVKDGFGCPFSGTGHQTGSFHGHVVMSRVGGGSISVSGE